MDDLHAAPAPHRHRRSSSGLAVGRCSGGSSRRSTSGWRLTTCWSQGSEARSAAGTSRAPHRLVVRGDGRGADLCRVVALSTTCLLGIAGSGSTASSVSAGDAFDRPPTSPACLPIRSAAPPGDGVRQWGTRLAVTTPRWTPLPPSVRQSLAGAGVWRRPISGRVPAGSPEPRPAHCHATDPFDPWCTLLDPLEGHCDERLELGCWRTRQVAGEVAMNRS